MLGEKAHQPEDLTRLFVQAANAGDADGIAELYEQDAVMAYPPGSTTVGREAIRELWAKILAQGPRFEPEAPLPTLVSGARAQVVRRQPDGTWLRVLDQPEFRQPG